MKVILVLGCLIISLYCPVQLQYMPVKAGRERILNKIKKYQPENAERITDVYIDVSHRYGIPVDYLERQGWFESRYDRLRRGDGGESYGIHQIKIKYWSHVLYEIKDKYVKNEIENCRKSGKPVQHEKLMQYIGGGIESAAYILSNYYRRYGTWEAAFFAYACGTSHRSMAKVIENKNHAYANKYFRYVLMGDR